MNTVTAKFMPYSGIKPNSYVCRMFAKFNEIFGTKRFEVL